MNTIKLPPVMSADIGSNKDLGLEIVCNRATGAPQYGDSLLIGQYSGLRLAEDTWELPEGSNIKGVLLKIDAPECCL